MDYWNVLLPSGTPIGRFVGGSASERRYYHTDHLGSTRAVTDGSGQVVERRDHYPFGLQMPGRALAQGPQADEDYTGHALDDETGMHYAGARFYMSALGRWGTADPLADKYPSHSSYNYTLNNPINAVDPDGMAVSSPIYDRDGNLLGTDDEGLQGKAIVMDEENFEQGMSHEEALDNSLGPEGLNGEEAISNLLESYSSLPSRPDYDGFVGVDEGAAWAREHPNALNNPTPENTLYIDASQLDFGNVSTTDFADVGEVTPVNLLNPGNMANSLINAKLRGTVYALGRVNMILRNRSAGTVSIVNDSATDYDWNTGGTYLRDQLIRAERARSGLGDEHGFKAYYYGTGTLNQ